MPSILRALLLVACTTACTNDVPVKPAADAAPAKQPAAAAKPEPAKVDPILVKVCKAFDEVSAGGTGDRLMARTAVRASELGVGEAELAALGPQPSQLLASIRARGNPPECAGFVAYLAAQP